MLWDLPAFHTNILALCKLKIALGSLYVTKMESTI
jgi:hypothetical protein